MFEQDSLPAAARSHEDEDFAGFNLEIDAFEDFEAIEAFAQAAHLQLDSASFWRGSAHRNLLSPALSSKGGEGEDVTGLSFRLNGFKRSIKQDAGKDVIQNHNQDDGVDDGFGHRTANATRPAACNESLMTADNANDDAEDEAFENTIRDIFDIHGVTERGEERSEGNIDLVVGKTDKRTAEPTDQDGKDDQ